MPDDARSMASPHRRRTASAKTPASLFLSTTARAVRCAPDRRELRLTLTDPDLFRRERGKDRRIETATREDANRDVGHHLFLDRALDKTLRFRNRIARRNALDAKRYRIPVANSFNVI